MAVHIRSELYEMRHVDRDGTRRATSGAELFLGLKLHGTITSSTSARKAGFHWQHKHNHKHSDIKT